MQAARPNKYGIPETELKKIRLRDQMCAYCHSQMKAYAGVAGTPADKATIEHLNYLPPWNNSSTVVICCGRCNSSRGKKKLLDWFKSPYCIEKNICETTVTEPVKDYVRYVESFLDRMTWTFAKTMLEIPHEYIARDNLSADDKETFDAFRRYVEKKGYSGSFSIRTYTYLNFGKYKYWVIENILNREKIAQA